MLHKPSLSKEDHIRTSVQEYVVFNRQLEGWQLKENPI
jgi:hypothetical protein